MKWEIRGADRATGAPRTILVEAIDEEEAGLKGKYKGLVVSAVAYHSGDPEDPAETEFAEEEEREEEEAAAPARPSAPASPKRPTPASANPAPDEPPDPPLRAMRPLTAITSPHDIPGYDAIPSASRWLSLLASVFSVLAILYVIFGLIAMACVAVGALKLTDGSASLETVLLILWIFAFAVGGAVLFACAAALRMAAAAGTALRDVARNSFRHE